MQDLRLDFWGDCAWYQDLTPPAANERSAWFLAKGDVQEWYAQVANRALEYSVALGLADHYRARFRGIRAKELTETVALSEARTPSFPIWEILAELVVAVVCDRVLGWTFVQHEPPGHQGHRGDWLFRTRSATQIFIEVKTLGELAALNGSGMRSSFAPRLRAVLKRAYRQLPSEGPTVTVVVGITSEALRIPFGLYYSDLVAAFFGEPIIRMDFDGRELTNPRTGPSFRSMFVQRKKHSRMGAVIAMNLRGSDEPEPVLYGVHNPFASAESSVYPDDLAPITRLVVQGDVPLVIEGMPSRVVWPLLARSRNEA